MRKTTKVTGTKIAQAAKDLNVTSVTIRRYISEFNIETTTDENGIKVLPESAMDELQEVRRLKEEGNTNPQVLEFLEERRASAGGEKAEAKPEKEKPKATRVKTTAKKEKAAPAADEDEDEDTPEVVEEEEEAPQAKQVRRRPAAKKEKVQEAEEPEASEEVESETEEVEAPEGEAQEGGDGRLKHSLTCQTCGKTFEHMNPRLRDCLDCYRAKRKERRRGGDRHKNVIQHPLAQQVVSKMANQQMQQQQEQQDEHPAAASAVVSSAPVQRRAPSAPQPQPRRDRSRDLTAIPSQNVGVTQPVIGGLKTQVRSYRKAIEETRQITGSLKRRLERPDLPEGDRRWLEQIYAYQLILHQGWRHLSEYRAQTNQQNKED
jgi:DNA-binding transcriptional MerR regulator